MKAFSSFYDYLLPELPSIGTAMVDLHLRLVARDVCDRMLAWVDADVSAIEPEDDTYAYDVTPSVDGVDLVRLLSMHTGDELTWRAADPVLLHYASQSPEQPKYQAHEPPFQLDADALVVTFDDVPTDTVQLTAALRPSMTATKLPDVLLTRHVDLLRKGVLARLKAMSGKPWTDLVGAALYQHQWDAAINQAASDSYRGNTRAQLRTRKTVI
jgi:hypothetical protein